MEGEGFWRRRNWQAVQAIAHLASPSCFLYGSHWLRTTRLTWSWFSHVCGVPGFLNSRQWKCSGTHGLRQLSMSLPQPNNHVLSEPKKRWDVPLKTLGVGSAIKDIQPFVCGAALIVPYADASPTGSSPNPVHHPDSVMCKMLERP